MILDIALINVRYLLAIVVAFIATLVALKSLKPYAQALSLQDIPRGRKQHKEPTPVIGGIGVVFAFIVVVFGFRYASALHPSFWVAALFLFIVGVLDDMREFSSKIKFIAQAMAALLMMFWGHVRLVDLGNLFGYGDVALGPWGVLVTIIGVMGVVNAFNMIDGIDGLCGTQSIVPLLVFAIVSMVEGNSALAGVLVILIVAIIGFLSLNLRTRDGKHAVVFLGDAGSLFLGFVIAWISIQVSDSADRVVKPAAVLWFLAIPLCDTVAVMLRRILHKQSPFKADRTHIHHVLQDLGFAVPVIVKILFFASLSFAVFGMAAILIMHIPDSILFCLFLLLFITYYFVKHVMFVSLHKKSLKVIKTIY